MEVKLRPSVPADFVKWQEMMRAYYVEDGHVYEAAVQCKAIDMLIEGDVPARGWLVEVDGVVQGYAVITMSFSMETGGMDGFIDELYISPNLRNLGIGAKVLDFIEGQAIEMGLLRLYLEVERENSAINLYKRAGYADHERFLLSKWLLNKK